jgi:hypothetical protein
VTEKSGQLVEKTVSPDPAGVPAASFGAISTSWRDPCSRGWLA